MIRTPHKDGIISEDSFCIGTGTRKMVWSRAEELDTINGHWLHQVSPSQVEDSRHKLKGQRDLAPEDTSLESVPESERDPVAGSKGHKVLVPSNEDQDEEGRSNNQRLFEEGFAESEHDQIAQAVRETANADRE